MDIRVQKSLFSKYIFIKKSLFIAIEVGKTIKELRQKKKNTICELFCIVTFKGLKSKIMKRPWPLK